MTCEKWCYYNEWWKLNFPTNFFSVLFIHINKHNSMPFKRLLKRITTTKNKKSRVLKIPLSSGCNATMTTRMSRHVATFFRPLFIQKTVQKWISGLNCLKLIIKMIFFCPYCVVFLIARSSFRTQSPPSAPVNEGWNSLFITV